MNAKGRLNLREIPVILLFFALVPNAACGGEQAAARQSPVDIAGYTESGAPRLEFAYGGAAAHITNTGDFIKVKYEDGGGIRLGGKAYRLIEAHTHNPSEHTVDGERFALEMHLVHQGEAGEIAVVGILYRLNKANTAIQAIIDAAPAQGGDDTEPLSPLAASDYLPANHGYYAYEGSLTTPPYTEGVSWLVMAEAQEMSAEQVAQLAALTGGGTNNRAVQPLNGRQITAYEAR